MSRPLLITDCDEVLLHMVAHFRAWVGEAHGLHFALDSGEFSGALTRHACGSVVDDAEVWPLLDGFFDSEMDRQTLAPGAAEALAVLGSTADIVILTNLIDRFHPGRVRQLEALGIRHRVVCNQGGKGPPIARLLDEYRPSVAAFVDDLAVHHASTAKHAPDVWRLHMVAEPELAPHVAPARHSHARIDAWPAASRWIADKFAAGLTAAQAAASASAP